MDNFKIYTDCKDIFRNNKVITKKISFSHKLPDISNITNQGHIEINYLYNPNLATVDTLHLRLI